jgi:uncharacterized protein (DUF305 family)
MSASTITNGISNQTVHDQLPTRSPDAATRAVMEGAMSVCMVVATAITLGPILTASRQTGVVQVEDVEQAEQGGNGDNNGDDNHGEDTVVLSWWQHPVNIIGLLVGIALIAGMVGWLIADASNDPGGSDVDVGFLQDMRIHHEQAVQMGFMYLALPDTSPGLREVARSIVFGQGIDIGRMIQLLRDMNAPEAAETDEAMAWMGMPTTHDQMPGMATEEQLDELGAARGAEADRLFVELMSAHHNGGIHMAQYAATEADRADVRTMAAAMADSQADEILELQGQLE